jgi:hypothetical protein
MVTEKLMTVRFDTQVCKLGSFCHNVKDGVCCMDCKIVGPMIKNKEYIVVHVVEKETQVYYMLDGWGSKLFNSKCFKIVNT